MGGKRTTETNIQKFVKNITVLDNGCWEWQGHWDGKNYGRMTCSDTKKQIFAHRWIYQYINGVKLPTDILVCHTCDYPPCCNPKHLWQGSNQDNVNDRQEKGRQRNKHTAKRYGRVFKKGPN